MRIRHIGVQRKVDSGTYIPESSRNPIDITMQDEHCLVGHFSKNLREFHNPHFITYGSDSLKKFITQKTGILLRLTGTGLERDAMRIPATFQGIEKDMSTAMEYFIQNKKWTTGFLVQDPDIAEQLIQQYQKSLPK